ncbi:MAG: Glu-tRNA(Gln) amidotransferase subunit GatD [Methanomicrobiales archaeon]|nr:Glu-tRNA(Gln) amidotransferase subunit GatD [Methanomicrobiales archaeon]
MMRALSGSRVRCRVGDQDLEGVYITEREGRAVVKLSSGYNIGIDIARLEVIGPSPETVLPLARIEQDPDLPECSIISTGGTIASRIDYRTGAVTSQFSAEDILRAIPELTSIARYNAIQVSTILSENMNIAIWQRLAHAIHDEIERGVRGVIVMHGTDTMAFTASAISFMVPAPVPIVFVGAQRSADRPSSDSAMNAICSAVAAVSGLGEVSVVMHDTTSDDRCAIHRATRVRKMHTSRRDAFQSIGIPPLGYVEYPSLKMTLSSGVVRRGERALSLQTEMEPRCALLLFAPGMPPDILEGYHGMKGLVISGTGLGHVGSDWVPVIRELIDGGTHVVMTSQCLHGRVCDRVYDTGRDLLAAGVIEGEDLLPEVALVKLSWILGREEGPEEVSRLMQQSLRGEICRRSIHGL